jgi:hypothetical protein
VRRGEAEFKRGESKSWRDVKHAISEGPTRIMEVDHKLIIPTCSRAKIARYLSYPVGAEQISAALAATPQFPELKLCFWRFDKLRPGQYEFIRAQYSIGGLASAFGGPKLPTFEIKVRAVPRIFRHRIKEYIVETALPQIAQWLVERAGLEQPGGDALDFSYDEIGEEFIPRTFTHLEPVRNRAH